MWYEKRLIYYTALRKRMSYTEEFNKKASGAEMSPLPNKQMTASTEDAAPDDQRRFNRFKVMCCSGKDTMQNFPGFTTRRNDGKSVNFS